MKNEKEEQDQNWWTETWKIWTRVSCSLENAKTLKKAFSFCSESLGKSKKGINLRLILWTCRFALCFYIKIISEILHLKRSKTSFRVSPSHYLELIVKEMSALFLTELFTLLAVFHKRKYIDEINLEMFSMPVLAKPEILIQNIVFSNNQLLTKNSYSCLMEIRIIFP